MRITVRLFAAHREAAGTGEVIADVAAGATVADGFARVCAAHPQLERLSHGVAFALNQTHVPGDAPLHDGDELAVLPPVAGG